MSTSLRVSNLDLVASLPTHVTPILLLVKERHGLIDWEEHRKEDFGLKMGKIYMKAVKMEDIECILKEIFF